MAEMLINWAILYIPSSNKQKGNMMKNTSGISHILDTQNSLCFKVQERKKKKLFLMALPNSWPKKKHFVAVKVKTQGQVPKFNS